LLTIVTRFYDLETRVMSHDESLHTYFSWLFYRGQGYQHSPDDAWSAAISPDFSVTYFLFGVSDFTCPHPGCVVQHRHRLDGLVLASLSGQDRRHHRRVPDGRLAVYAVLRALRPQRGVRRAWPVS
jgi:hypothetical protein